MLPLFVTPFPPRPQTLGNHWSFYCLRSCTFSKMPYGWNHTVCSMSDWPFPLSNRHLSFFHVLSWLLVLIIFHCLDVPHWLLTTLKKILHLKIKFRASDTIWSYWNLFFSPQKITSFACISGRFVFSSLFFCAVLFILCYHVSCALTGDRQ